MDQSFRLYQIRTVGLRVTAAKALRSFKRRLADSFGRRLTDRATFHVHDSSAPALVLPGLTVPDADVLAESVDELREHALRSLSTELWLPGYGWKSHAHGASCPGMEQYRTDAEPFPFEIDANGEWMERLINPANVREARRRWSLIRGPYTPLDWQRDHRSGYSWSEGVPVRDVRISPHQGADPKNPWDVARMHHALHSALAFGLEKDVAMRDAIAQNFRSRVLDVLASNPPGYGINWTVPMEVGIRMANILVAHHLFRLYGHTFDDAFLDVLATGMAEHAAWVVDHAEWSEGMRGNHFLSNLAGLAVCAAYMSPCALRDRIDAFLDRHLDEELLYQFQTDGSHFEASLAYHFFSAEMLAWCYAFRYLRRSTYTPPAEVRERLTAVHHFSAQMLSTNGIVPQIGDNDSGRFLPLLPFHRCAHDTDRGHRRSDVVALLGLLTNADVSSMHHALSVILGSRRHLPHSVPLHKQTMYRADDFGITVYRTSRCEWYMRAGSVGQAGRGGHAHNDQLSFVLLVDGQEFFTDPGTYTYTALPHERNRFRRTSSHNTVSVDGKEQHDLPRDVREGLFWVQSNDAHARTVRADKGTWVGVHRGFGVPHTRTMEFHDHEVRIVDECASTASKHLAVMCHPDVRVEKHSDRVVLCERNGVTIRVESLTETVRCESAPYSPEYGVRIASCRLVIPMHESRHELRCTVVER